jgi:uncharacterized protein (DUF4415 family)
MNAKLPITHTDWIDPDDAPELTDDFFEKATPMIGNRVVSKEEFVVAASKSLRRGRPKSPSVKQALTIRYDADIVEAFKSSGTGWQTRMNAALREWLQSHRVAR